MSVRDVALFVSGGGRSLENLAERIAAGDCKANIKLVLSNRADAFALKRAERLGIPTAVLDAERQLSPAEFASAAYELVSSHGCETIVLAGFLRLLPIPAAWEGRVLNIHPSLLPAFGGKGFYGERVHRAVIERGVQFTGCTVHYVTDEYDEGPVLLQRCIRVEPGENAESLAARVFEEEKLALPEALELHFARASQS